MGSACSAAPRPQAVLPGAEDPREAPAGALVAARAASLKLFGGEGDADNVVRPFDEGELLMEFFPPVSPHLSSKLSSWTIMSATSAAAYVPPEQPLILDHLLPRCQILVDNPKARTLFIKFVKESTWIDNLFSRPQEHFVNFSNKCKKTAAPTRSSFNLRLHQYIIPKSGARRTASEDEEIAGATMALIRKLKVNDLLVESSERKADLSTFMGRSAQRSALFASALAMFLRSADYRKYQSSGWPEDPAALKLHSLPSSRSLRGKSKKEDPFTPIKQMYARILHSVGEGEADALLSSTDWARELHEVVERLPFSIAICDLRSPDLHHRPLGYVNPAFCALSGYSVKEVLGRSCRLLQCDRSEPKQLEIVAEALRRHEACKVAVTNCTKSGRYFTNFLSLRPVIDRARGACTFVLGAQYDIDAVESSVHDLQLIDSLLLIYSQVLC